MFINPMRPETFGTELFPFDLPEAEGHRGPARGMAAWEQYYGSATGGPAQVAKVSLQPSSLASIVMSAFKTFDTGQPLLAACASF